MFVNDFSERQVDKFQRSVKTSEDAMRVMQERLGVFQKLFVGRESIQLIYFLLKYFHFRNSSCEVELAKDGSGIRDFSSVFPY